MKEIEIIIEGPPIPQPRPRFRRIGKFVSTYDPLSKIKEKLRNTVIIEQFKDSPIDKPISCDIEFHMPIPKSVKAEEGDVHVKRPDVDNLIKYSLDLLADIVFLDDKQIYEINAIKCYSKMPRTEIHFMYEN